jgi:uncharacterized protein (DUF2236 family)
MTSLFLPPWHRDRMTMGTTAADTHTRRGLGSGLETQYRGVLYRSRERPLAKMGGDAAVGSRKSDEASVPVRMVVVSLLRGAATTTR